MARGTFAPAPVVSSATDALASKPTKAQPQTASVASAAPSEVGAPIELKRTVASWVRKNTSSIEPMSIEAIISAAMPKFTATRTTWTPP
ncbi:MAG: hypothetical protein E5W86_13610, partial [Mesorhizobium sp.]